METYGAITIAVSGEQYGRKNEKQRHQEHNEPDKEK